MLLQPPVYQVALKKPFARNLGGGQPLGRNQIVYLFLIYSNILRNFLGVHQRRHDLILQIKIKGKKIGLSDHFLLMTLLP